MRLEPVRAPPRLNGGGHGRCRAWRPGQCSVAAAMARYAASRIPLNVVVRARSRTAPPCRRRLTPRAARLALGGRVIPGDCVLASLPAVRTWRRELRLPRGSSPAPRWRLPSVGMSPDGDLRAAGEPSASAVGLKIFRAAVCADCHSHMAARTVCHRRGDEGRRARTNEDVEPGRSRPLVRIPTGGVRAVRSGTAGHV